ncbi:MAG: DUF255 domain-containing protein [Sulfuricaulis sp.]
MFSLLSKFIATTVFLGLWLFAMGDGAVAAETAQAAATAPDSEKHVYTNRLIHSNDPYLLLHAHNPVDWYPWGPEALARAKRENKPIFVSIGYSTCYWCHVAERTIYSNPQIAQLMNKWFINIKVDREQRPDLDEIYMLATQLMTGQGGWPNNVFLTPDLKPIFAGSYFPPADDDMGRPGFPNVLQTIHEEWTTNREDVMANADRVFQAMQQERRETPGAAETPLAPAAWLKQARAAWLPRYDSERAGFSSGNREMKFPQEPVLEMFLTDYRMTSNPEDLKVLTQTLSAMALGGIYDQLGGGFHRYSTDRSWSIPHFEKMLYDNAQLLSIYVQAYELTHDVFYRYIAEDLRAYLIRRMTTPKGGFYTAEDAEVGGEEGASYLWTRKEIVSILGTEPARKFFRVYALTPMPGQNGETVLNDNERGVLRVDSAVVKQTGVSGAHLVKKLEALAPLRATLLAAREKRPQPMRDEKLIVSLNGLAIEAFVQDGRAFHRPEDIALARRAAARIWSLAYDPKNGRLLHEIFRGRAQTDGYLDDYAIFGRALLSLHAATGEKLWLDRASLMADAIHERFQDRIGTLATTAGGDKLPIVLRDSGDDVYPSGTSVAIDLLLRLAQATGKSSYATAADRALRQLSSRMQQEPEAWPVLVSVVSSDAARQAKNGRELAAKPVSSTKPPIPTRDVAKSLASLSTASHVRVTASILNEAGPTRVIFTLHVDPGYHINANPASLNYLIPTSVSFEELAPKKITYPQPNRIRPDFAKAGLDVYEGEVRIDVVLPLGVWRNKKVLRAVVTAQACTDQVCLPPAKLPVAVQIPASQSQ